MEKRKKNIANASPSQPLLDRGSQYLERHDYIAALREFEKAWVLARTDPEVLFKLGVAYDYLKMFDQALSFYRRALRLAPDMAGAWEYSGVVHHERRNYESAIKAYDEAIKLAPNYPYAYYNKALTLRGLGELSKAIEFYDKAIRLAPKYGPATLTARQYNENFRRQPAYVLAERDGLLGSQVSYNALPGEATRRGAVAGFAQTLRGQLPT